MVGKRFLSPLALSFACAVAFGGKSAGAAQDLAGLDLERLMEVKVYAASKYEQGQAEVPSAVSVVTAEDIRTYGWRTLGDILSAQRGMYMSYDRIYGYVGSRGILVSGDLNSRMVVTIDGHRTNDVVYQQAFVLNDFLLDTDLIERVEVIRGPGSSLHGATPLFGVINIVTRDPRRSPMHEVGLEAGRHGWSSGRYTFTKLFENNASLMVSASRIDYKGPDLRFDPPGQLSRKSDYEDANRFLLKLEAGDLRLMLAHSKRDKGIPSGATGAVLDNPENRYTDTQTAFNLTHTWRLANRMELEGRFFAGAYDFHGNLLYAPAPLTTNKDLAWGRWQGTEWKLTRREKAHTWVAGFEYQRNARQDQKNYDVGGTLWLDDRRDSHHVGLYFQDEWHYAPTVALTLGGRYDRDYRGVAHFSPRLAWVFNPSADRTLKLIASSAFRSPNVAEVHYDYGGRFLRNLGLKAEHIRTWEAVYEQRLGPRTQVTVNPYFLKLEDRIVQVQTLPVAPFGVQYQNGGSARVVGIELEAEHRYADGSRLRASYSRLRGEDGDGRRLTDSPRDMATLNYARRLAGDRLRLGVEYQHVGGRLTFMGRHTGPARLLNIHLGGQLWKRGPEWSVGLYNALDHGYATPDTPDPALPRDRIEQDGRTWRAKLTLPF